MKPKDLKFPFTWEERRPLLESGVFYVPGYFQEHDPSCFPSLEGYFGNTHPISIEFCSGNGEWIVEKAKDYPKTNWIAVEKKFKRVRKIWSKMRNFDLSNLLIIRGEAKTFSKHYLADSSMSSMYINFPDPWPKDRHAKHRLLQEEFIHEMSRVMIKSGKAMVVTDDVNYSEQIVTEMLKVKNWEPSYPEPYFITQLENYGGSYFYRLWKDLERKIHFMEFNNRGRGI